MVLGFGMDPQRRDELDYLAERIASEADARADERKRQEAQAAWGQAQREREARETSHLSTEQKMQRGALQKAAHQCLSLQRHVDSGITELEARDSARGFRRWAVVLALSGVAWLLMMFGLVPSIRDNAGASFVVALLMLGNFVLAGIAVFKVAINGLNWWGQARASVSAKSELSKRRREVERLYSKVDFYVGHTLGYELAKLGIKSRP